MLRIRILETRLQVLCDSGELAADLHFTKGQEAIAVGVCAALGEKDILVCHHRMIGWAVSKGIPLNLLVAELLGKASGICGGLAGEMHMQAMEYGFAHSFQLVGTVVPVAAGVAWALKNYKRNGGIAVSVFGDAATANGQFHEGLNIAATQSLPLLLVCENNHLAGNIGQEYYIPPNISIHDRGIGYGIGSVRVNGNDVEEVSKVAQYAINVVRSEGRPFLLECDTTRLGKHKQGMGDMRTPELKEALALRDPLRNAVFEPGYREGIEAEIDQLIEEIQQEANPILPILESEKGRSV